MSTTRLFPGEIMFVISSRFVFLVWNRKNISLRANKTLFWRKNMILSLINHESYNREYYTLPFSHDKTVRLSGLNYVPGICQKSNLPDLNLVRITWWAIRFVISLYDYSLECYHRGQTLALIIETLIWTINLNWTF